MNSQLLVKSFTEEGDAVLNNHAVSSLQYIVLNDFFQFSIVIVFGLFEV